MTIFWWCLKVTVDLQRPVLIKFFFHTKFKTSTLSNFPKKIFPKLKTRTGYPQKRKFLKRVNEPQTVISQLCSLTPNSDTEIFMSRT